MESGYQQEQLGGGRVRFTVIPASAPPARGGPAALAIVIAVLSIVTTPARVPAPWLAARIAISGSAAAWAYRATLRWRAKRVDRARSPGGTFVVSASSLEVPNGSCIPKRDVRRLIVRNGIVGDAATAGAAVARPSAGTVSFMLCAEGGGETMTLAGGMTESIARGLLTDVSRILRLT